MFQKQNKKKALLLNGSKEIIGSDLYRGLLGQHGPCCNTNTWPSLANYRPSILFSLKTSKVRPNVWKAQPRV